MPPRRFTDEDPTAAAAEATAVAEAPRPQIPAPPPVTTDAQEAAAAKKAILAAAEPAAALRTAEPTPVERVTSRRLYNPKTGAYAIFSPVLAAKPGWVEVDGNNNAVHPVLVDGKVLVTSNPHQTSDIPTDRLQFVQASGRRELQAILFGAGIERIQAANGEAVDMYSDSPSNADLLKAVMRLEVERENVRKAKLAEAAAK